MKHPSLPSSCRYKVERSEKHSLADGTAATTASGALYVACNVCTSAGAARTMKEISDETGAAEVGGGGGVRLRCRRGA